jgi:hypothetical protein
MSLIRKVIRGIGHPLLAFDAMVVRVRKSRMDLDLERRRLLEWLARDFHLDVERERHEYINSDFHRWFRTKLNELPSRRGTTSAFDCEALYLIVRAAKPSIVVETGVLHGASSAQILYAFERNGGGRLYSVDLPRVEGPGQDALVPRSMKDAWKLELGDARNVLPRLLNDLGRIDMFHHDSLHTYEHMLFEYESALAHLNPTGLISSHDVLTGPIGGNAFDVFCERHALRGEVFRNIGVARYRADREAPPPV